MPAPPDVSPPAPALRAPAPNGSSAAMLHVAALPFPTRQGTQAAIRSMMDALAAAGRNAHLLTYADGESPRPPAGWTHHRTAPMIGTPSFRSGPSVRKIAQDALLTRSVRQLARRLRPAVIVAHHVEAATACRLAGIGPRVFVAHTSLADELPTYGLGAVPGASALAGRWLEQRLIRGADSVATVSPLLRQTLQAARPSAPIQYVPIPWTLHDRIENEERDRSRRRFGFHPDDRVLLYAGNLDAYQGWEDVVAALAQLAQRRPRALLLVATESHPGPLLQEAWRRGAGHLLRLTGLGDEAHRRAAHAAADLAVVPRRAPGGLPVKLLDAWSHGLATVVTERATAGLPLGDFAFVTNNDDPAHLASAAQACLDSPETARARGERGRAYIARHHGPNAFVAALDEAVRTATSLA